MIKIINKLILIDKTKKQESFLIKHQKPNVRQEGKCVRKIGGTITKHKDNVRRIENQLDVSRTLDDYLIDKHILPAFSDLVQYSKQSSLAYIIRACLDSLIKIKLSSFIVTI